ncbi:hypothetical protein ARMSODRAFT_980760 [Armillaria solidipes]|uniref:Uncharacterized protein n=1 Tax=Armillaria solidipes TaxID=1076256 RepID=A0A2H3AUR7_9AGAR|nr:hypothetical protein ARMSODRAFT_980760 [Armillaria solidipes]
MKYIYLSYKMFGYCLVKEMALVKTPKLSLGRSGWYGSLEDELWRVWANGEMASHLVILSLYSTQTCQIERRDADLRVTSNSNAQGQECVLLTRKDGKARRMKNGALVLSTKISVQFCMVSSSKGPLQRIENLGRKRKQQIWYYRDIRIWFVEPALALRLGLLRHSQSEAAARSPGSGYPSTKTRCQNENELVQSVSCHVVCYCRYTANMDEAWRALGTEQRSFDEEGLDGAYDEEQHYGVEREDISPVLYSFGFKEVLQSIDSRRNLGRVGRQKIQHYRDISMDKRN